MLAVTVGLSMFWSSFELLSASKTSVMSNRGPDVELLLVSWPSGTLDSDRARCRSLATALGKDRRMLNPGLPPAVCNESGPLPVDAYDRSPWPVPPSSPLAVLAFAPISHATNGLRPDNAADGQRRADAAELSCASYYIMVRASGSAARTAITPVVGRRRKKTPEIRTRRNVANGRPRTCWRYSVLDATYAKTRGSRLPIIALRLSRRVERVRFRPSGPATATKRYWQ